MGMNKKIILSIVIISLLFAPSFSYAAIPLVNPNNVFSEASFMTVVTNVANFIIQFIAILGIIFLVYGGLLYVTSAGDDSQMEKARTTITYAIIGLFLTACAYAIEKLVLQQLFV